MTINTQIESAVMSIFLLTHCVQILGNASAISDNPTGVSFIATLPDEAFDKAAYPNGGNVKGSVQAVSTPDGKGVMFHVSFSNLPPSGGPFRKWSQELVQVRNVLP